MKQHRGWIWLNALYGLIAWAIIIGLIYWSFRPAHAEAMSQGEQSEGDRARDRRGSKGRTEPSSHCAPLSAGRSRQFNQP